MARRVFFSFEYEHDVSRAMVVRNSWVTQGKEAAGFVDAADFEKIKRGGDAAIKKWIREQLHGTSVTVVLVGSHTCASRYVQYEIKDLRGSTTQRCGQIPKGYEFYYWNRDEGYTNLGDWIEKAARDAGR